MPKQNEAQIDVLSTGQGGIQASGDVAMRLLQANMDINALRTCDVLRKDQWIELDRVIVEIARKRLVGVGTLMQRGLTHSLGSNAMGITQLQWENVDEMTDAEVTMSGLAEAERDRLTYELKSMPLPIIHKDFQINLRNLESSRRFGTPLDTSQAEMAARIVTEKVESILFNGYGLTVAGSTIYGLTTEPNRNTGANVDWEAGATTGEAKLDDLIAMITALVADNMYGPYGLYITPTAYTLLGEDFKAASDKTQLQRLMEVPGLEFILPSKDLGTNVQVMHQLTSDVAQEVIGFEPTTVMWESHGGMMLNFKVMAIMLPRVRSTKTGQSGIVHLS